jgi:gliding motility-associated-like protein
LTVNPTYQINQFQSICFGDSVLFGGVYQNSTGIYYDSLQTTLGCDSLIITGLSVYNVYNDTVFQSICEGDSLILGGGLQGGTGFYLDSFQSLEGCDSVVTTLLTVNLISNLTGSDDLTLTPCEEVQLFVSGGNSYFWSPNLGLNCTTCDDPIANPNTTTTYTVVDSSNNCNTSFTVTVFVEGETAFLIPNVFSPNGDGINDDFNIESDCINTINKQIYNRWGTLIFDSNQLDEVWDGRTTSGKEVPEGTYFYIFETEIIVGGNLTSKTFKGSLSLLR